MSKVSEQKSRCHSDREQFVAAFLTLLQTGGSLFTQWLSGSEIFQLLVGLADKFRGQANADSIETAVVAPARDQHPVPDL